jgi:hypothetical protein
MRTADRSLDDEQLIERVFEAQARRWLNSRTRGRRRIIPQNNSITKCFFLTQ